ncbi:MAG: MBL fold metallo-hydrolase [Armatimonadota bacterium]
MKIQILGTAAAEGWPGIFCGCDTCKRARAAGGKNLRSRSSVQIDDIYKIDLPPDTYYHVIRHGLDLSHLKYLFYTHSHGDHFAPDEIEYTREGFSHNLANAPIKVYANSKVISAVKSLCDQYEMPLEPHPAEPFMPIQADDLTFTPIIASHAKGEQCLNYVIKSKDATVLYASDTGDYCRETLDFLSRLKFDLLIVECTFGLITPHRAVSHMNLDSVIALHDHLTRSGAVTSSTRTIITHFSHNIGVLHEELEEAAGKYGIDVAYDGIILNV